MRFPFSSQQVELFHLAWPIVLQGLLNTLFLVIDSIMVAPLGKEAIAAMGISSAIFLIIFSIQLGTANGTQMLMSQAFGAKNIARLKGHFFCGILTNLLISIPFFVCILLEHVLFIKIYTSSTILVEETWRFLSISIYIIPITAITLPFGFLFRSQRKGVIPLKGFALELMINIVLNFLLIYGYWGLPRMGLQGAAIAAVIARFFRLSYFFIHYKLDLPSMRQPVKFQYGFMATWQKNIIFVGPFILSSLALTLGGIVYQIVFAHSSLNDYTAYTLLLPWLGIGITIINAIASASAIQVGCALGSGNFKQAALIAKTCISTALIVSIILAAVLLFSGTCFQKIYSNMPKDVIYTLNTLLPLSALLLVKKR
jgi:putative MATE family efflux protein